VRRAAGEVIGVVGACVVFFVSFHRAAAIPGSGAYGKRLSTTPGGRPDARKQDKGLPVLKKKDDTTHREANNTSTTYGLLAEPPWSAVAVSARGSSLCSRMSVPLNVSSVTDDEAAQMTTPDHRRENDS
jgi:hypothetical protein